jgi:hypothetical protein
MMIDVENEYNDILGWRSYIIVQDDGTDIDRTYSIGTRPGWRTVKGCTRGVFYDNPVKSKDELLKACRKERKHLERRIHDLKPSVYRRLEILKLVT